MNDEFGKYAGILYSYPGPAPGHTPMPIHDRAAQFAPFAALTGFGSMITETGRLTEEWRQPDEYELEALDRRLSDLQKTDPAAAVKVLWFRPDADKAGGSYLETIGTVYKTDLIRRKLVLMDTDHVPAEIPVDRIVSMEYAEEKEF